MPTSLSCPFMTARPNSSLLHCVTPHSLLPKNSPCFTRIRISTNSRIQGSGFLAFAALQNSTTNSLKGITSVSCVPVTSPDKIDLAREKNDATVQGRETSLLFGKSNAGLQVHDLVETVSALSASQRLGIVDKIEKNGGFQSINIFNDLLMALVREDEFELALKLSSNSSAYGLNPDKYTYTVLMSCYCKKNDPMEAKCVLDHMLEKRFQPNVATFTTLINSFCKNGRLQKAFEVFDIMLSIGCEPTINTYNCLLKGLCYVGKVEEAYELLANIKKSSMKPDIYTYTAVMNGFCKVGRSDEAMELLEEAVEIGLIPNVVTYNTLFNGYFKEGRPLDGIGLLQRMKEKHCGPDHVIYGTLVHGLLKWGETPAALQIYKEMMETGFELDDRMMNALLRALCRRSRKHKGLLKDAYQLFKRMRSRGCPIYPCAYDLVIQAFCNGKRKIPNFKQAYS